MKTLQTIIAGILIVSCFVLSYSTVNFELAERHFENVRNGLACNRPGSSCPGPDFDSPVFYGIIGLGLYFAGMIMSIFKERKNMTRIALGATALVAGMPSLVSGVLAYANDYTHLVLVMKNCPNTSCMYPNIFSNLPIIQFFGIYGSILIGVGAFCFVYFRGRNKK